eukprot:5921259-Heterocapsa_arctica.AAC.1
MARPSAASSSTRRNAPAETTDDYKTFQFGQYKGDSFKEITEEEPHYYEWAKKKNKKPAKYLLAYIERVDARYDYESQEHRPPIEFETVPRTKMTKTEVPQLSDSSDSNCVRTFESGS